MKIFEEIEPDLDLKGEIEARGEFLGFGDFGHCRPPLADGEGRRSTVGLWTVDEH